MHRRRERGEAQEPAMEAVTNDSWPDVEPRLMYTYKELKQSNDPIATEDAAWIDSCLVKDPDLPDDTWSALKDALLEIISLGANSNHEPSSYVEPEGLNSEEVETTQTSYSLKNDFYNCPLLDMEDEEVGAEAAKGSINGLEAEENIFRVWDLNVEFEEEEIVQQLKEALAATPIKDLPSLSKSPTSVENMEINYMDVVSDEEKLDDLIASMADLSILSFQ